MTTASSSQKVLPQVEGEHLPDVRDQYEDLPYPPYDPEMDKFSMVTPFSCNMDLVCHHIYGGARDYRKGKTRILVAGGGTGSATIAYAEPLRNNPEAEIVYLDMSRASMEVCQKRAELRGLTNIRWVHDSLLNIPNLDLGEFDLIQCSGVLHHLASPEEGLLSLKSVLKPDGAVFVMLYGYYGRTSVYIMQDLLRHMTKGVADKQKKIDMTRALLKGGMPATNPFTRDYRRFVTDLSTDSGLYDLLLHSQDRAYTIPQLYDYAEGCGMVLDTVFSFDREMGSISLDPALYIRDLELLSHVLTLPLRDQQAIAELIAAHASKQECIISKQPLPKPDLSDLETVPALSVSFPTNGAEMLREIIEKVPIGKAAEVKATGKEAGIVLPRTPHLHLMLRYLDGERSQKEIFRQVMDHPEARKTKPNYLSLKAEFDRLFNTLHAMHWMFLRKPGIPRFATHHELQEHMYRKYPGAKEAYYRDNPGRSPMGAGAE